MKKILILIILFTLFISKSFAFEVGGGTYNGTTIGGDGYSAEQSQMSGSNGQERSDSVAGSKEVKSAMGLPDDGPDPTKEQIEKFQDDNHITVDGKIGPETLGKMQALNESATAEINDNSTNAGSEASPNPKCTSTSTGNMACAAFEIGVDSFLGKNNLKDSGSVAKNTINTVLGTVIQKLMIALGSIALLIMTIGAGYMIMYSGHDELLSKGKSIFNAGIISLIVSLLSYYMVSLLKFILYS